jgi:hypothetical protein
MLPLGRAKCTQGPRPPAWAGVSLEVPPFAGSGSHGPSLQGALPPNIPEGRFKGYMSPGYAWDTCTRRVSRIYREEFEEWQKEVTEEFEEWQNEVTDGLPVQFMRRHMMLTEIRSKRTDAPSEPAPTAAAVAAATNAAATSAAEEIARREHELGEMTHRLRTVSTPKTFYPATRDPQEVSEWVAWCNNTQWGTNTTESSDQSCANPQPAALPHRHPDWA